MAAERIEYNQVQRKLFAGAFNARHRWNSVAAIPLSSLDEGFVDVAIGATLSLPPKLTSSLVDLKCVGIYENRLAASYGISFSTTRESSSSESGYSITALKGSGKGGPWTYQATPNWSEESVDRASDLLSDSDDEGRETFVVRSGPLSDSSSDDDCSTSSAEEDYYIPMYGGQREVTIRQQHFSADPENYYGCDFSPAPDKKSLRHEAVTKFVRECLWMLRLHSVNRNVRKTAQAVRRVLPRWSRRSALKSDSKVLMYCRILCFLG
ncbi:hypothetical protein QAD02_021160 [Eretmocerus hayati]|uniref:Uncharacterized protein n=1 Tax=Eretmocerus hayati TaxID=131215 RepID=A0ACC2PPP2_9HYME|nr:hypothetical protein QAD02_021160 [Eretmocerus hayati]